MNITAGGASFGYLSAFGSLNLPDTIYKCEGASTTLDGGYAKSYLWTRPDGSHDSTSTIIVSAEGMYSVTIDQDPFLISDSTVIVDRFSGASIVSSGNDVGGGNYTYSVNLNGQTLSNVVYTWKIDSIPVATTDVFNITWTDSSEKVITVELFDTVLNCKKTLSIMHYKLPDNINDSDCYTDAQGNTWKPILLLKSSPVNYFAYGSPVLAGDLDSDGDVEIVLNDGSPDFGTKLVILGNDLNVKYTLTSSERFANTTVTFSMANVDGGANAAIFIATRYRQLKKFILNTSTKKYEEAWSVLYSTNVNYDMGNPLITDFNGDGYAEISIYDKIFDARTGTLLANGNYLGIGSSNANPYKFGMKGGHPIHSTNAIHASIMAAGDIDGDGFPELIGGNCVYKVIINSRTNPALNSFTLFSQASTIGHPEVGDGSTSLADMDLDGKLDVIVTRNISTSYHGLYIWNPRTGEVIHSDIINNLYVSNSGNFGPSLAAIGNLDSDPLPEIAFIGFDYMYVYDYYPTTKHLIQKWNRYVNDESAITLFDFNQDNKFELVYRDFTNLMVIEGETQQVLTNISCGSNTANEYPLILDINNDGHAEFVIVAGGNSALNGTVRIYGLNTWAPARKVWNQYAYNAVNVNEDLTIPRYPLNPATVFPGADGILGTTDDVRPYNGYLMQQTILNKNGMPLWLIPDATFAGMPVFNYYANGDSLVISLLMTNIGDAPLQIPCYISIYKNTMSIANKLTTDSTVNIIYPDDTSTIHIVVHNINSHLPIDSIIINLNDKGQTVFVQQECDTSNNTVIKDFLETLTTVQDSICYGTIYNKNGFNFIALHDTIVTMKIPIGDGYDSLTRLHVHVFDTSLYVFSDTINLGEYSYNKFGFSLPKDSLKYTGTNLYTVTFTNIFGCDSIHLLYLTIAQTWLFSDTMIRCQHVDEMWRNKPLQTSIVGTFIVWDSLKTEQGGDSLYRLTLIIQPTYFFDDTLAVCRNEIANWHNKILPTSIVGTFIFWDSLQTSYFGCDSLYKLTLIVQPSYFFNDTLMVCHNAIANWHRIQLPTAVTGTFTLWDSLKTSHYSCDSIYELTLIVNVIPDFEIKTTGNLCEDDSIKLYVDVENVSYHWTTGDTTNYTVVCQNGVYGISVSIVGCTTLQNIHIECPCDLWLPNIFTPNKDQINEDFLPVSTSALHSFSMYIYDRWGSLIYKTDTLTPWNGTYKGGNAVAGVYYCVVRYSCTNDPTKILTKQGSITLVR
jgi:gliding motility-associated-like protein